MSSKSCPIGKAYKKIDVEANKFSHNKLPWIGNCCIHNLILFPLLLLLLLTLLFRLEIQMCKHDVSLKSLLT